MVMAIRPLMTAKRVPAKPKYCRHIDANPIGHRNCGRERSIAGAAASMHRKPHPARMYWNKKGAAKAAPFDTRVLKLQPPDCAVLRPSRLSLAFCSSLND